MPPRGGLAGGAVIAAGADQHIIAGIKDKTVKPLSETTPATVRAWVQELRHARICGLLHPDTEAHRVGRHLTAEVLYALSVRANETEAHLLTLPQDELLARVEQHFIGLTPDKVQAALWQLRCRDMDGLNQWLFELQRALLRLRELGEELPANPQTRERIVQMLPERLATFVRENVTLRAPPDFALAALQRGPDAGEIW
ncbi:MAG: hypothetical protein QG597_4641 [Actinomycetota bacterium]|nr:hypothetical protein [Actinomycetota bacterium]